MSAYWICDRCGEKIESPKDGWVEWIVYHRHENGDRMGRDLRLVHHLPASPLGPPNGCQFNQEAEFSKDRGVVADLSLKDFFGPNGLMRLLVFLSEDELPKPEVLEMIKRIHIPGYEIARGHFDRAISEGVFEPNTPKGFYFQHDIEAVLKFMKRDNETGSGISK